MLIPDHALTCGSAYTVSFAGARNGRTFEKTWTDDACSDASPPTDPASDVDRDILATGLSIDLATRLAVADTQVAPSEQIGLNLNVGDLEILEVTNGTQPLNYRIQDADGRTETPEQRIHIALGAGVRAVIRYRLAVHSQFDGWAAADCRWLELGTTPAGTRVRSAYLAGHGAAAVSGTARLRDVFAWYEANLGAYPWGSKAASVEVDWSGNAYGGMEHHPYWHVETANFGDLLAHAHEATHGWYGNRVRLACWEDLVYCFVVDGAYEPTLIGHGLARFCGSGFSRDNSTGDVNRTIAAKAAPTSQVAALKRTLPSGISSKQNEALH